MSKSEFWKIADTFRDPRVWFIKNKEWLKSDVWGGFSAYGDVYLDGDQIEKYNQRQKKLLDRTNF